MESDFYWLPQGQIAPPALGTSRQWILQVGNPTFAASSNNRISFPRLGGFLDTLILEIRDANNARVAAFPSLTNRFVLYIDGVPIEDAPMWKLLDDDYIAFHGLTLPTGVYVYTRKTSLSQETLGLAGHVRDLHQLQPGHPHRGAGPAVGHRRHAALHAERHHRPDRAAGPSAPGTP